jgi:hypothetical protein
MKVLRIAVSFLLFTAATTAFAAPNAQQSFDKLKTLAGQWEGKSSKGIVQVSYRVMANDSSIVSEINAPGDNMISVFHMDKDRLLLTHYCGAGNQPRMQATTSPDGKSITFDFVDGTNIMPSQMGHMRRLIVTMSDANHHLEEWIFATNDGKEMRELFELQRKK